MQQAKKKFENKMQQQQLSGHQKISNRKESSQKNNISPPPESMDTQKTDDDSSANLKSTTPNRGAHSQDNPLQQSYPDLPDTVFKATLEQRPRKQEQGLDELHKLAEQAEITEKTDEEQSTLMKDPGDNNGDNFENRTNFKPRRISE